MEAGKWEALSEPEWQMLESAIAEFRQPLLAGLLALQPDWYEGELPIEAVAEMRIVKYQPFAQKAPSGRLVDLAGAERGDAPRGHGEFIRKSMVGLPIAVGRNLAGPLTLVEGYTRCCRALRDYRTGLFDGLPIAMVVGVADRIAEWSWMW